MWSIIVKSKNKISDRCKNFIADLVNGECHTAAEGYKFILHDILETKRSLEAIIEGKKHAVENIAKSLRSNIKYEVLCRRITKNFTGPSIQE